MTRHEHRPTLGTPPPSDPLARPVNTELLDQLLGAMLDACPACQVQALDEVQADPVTTARVVELACLAVIQDFGWLPAALTDNSRPGSAHPSFRAMARAGADCGPAALVAEARRQSDRDRRHALTTALDLLAGLL